MTIMCMLWINKKSPAKQTICHSPKLAYCDAKFNGASIRATSSDTRAGKE